MGITAYETVRIKDDEDEASTAGNIAKKVLESGEYNEHENRLVYGNRNGVSLLEEINASRERAMRQDSKMAALQDNFATLNHKIATLTNNEKLQEQKRALLTHQNQGN